eukprot:1069028-Prymnesium_polylepis.1
MSTYAELPGMIARRRLSGGRCVTASGGTDDSTLLAPGPSLGGSAVNCDVDAPLELDPARVSRPTMLLLLEVSCVNEVSPSCSDSSEP